MHRTPFTVAHLAGCFAICFSMSLMKSRGGLPEEQPLWSQKNWENPIQYSVPEAVQRHPTSKTSLSGMNRVFRDVSVPTCTLHVPATNAVADLGIVICPGGGFRELWVDREGNDLALWLKARGITALVLKYRTNSEVERGKRKFPQDLYLRAVVEDARQAIKVLRSRLAETRPGTAKVGICGFSAGGALAMYSVLQPGGEAGANKDNGRPDFAGLFYPGLRNSDSPLIAEAKKIPPLFIMNAIDDQTTPVGPCVDFYQRLLKAGARAELHLYNKGGHGFDMGEGHGDSVTLWKENFVAWLKDNGFIPTPER
jgi:acetyl esterase/lipase